MSVVVITGASAGIGRATARAFANRGDRLGLLARGPEGLAATREEVVAAGSEAVAVPTDVADPDAVEEAAAAVEESLGPIDVWVNNAMASVLAPIVETTPEEFRRVTEVTYLGYVHGTLAALRRMLPRDRGTIIQVGSALAYRGIPLQAPYCAAKHAIKGFTESLRCELLHDGSQVKVTMVHLAGTNTPQFGWVRSRLPRHPRPMPPVFEPEVAARGIVWAAGHPHRREVQVGGSTAATIWAGKLMGGVLDRYLARGGFEAQEAEDTVPAGRPDNLFCPVDGDRGAHGVFGDEAHPRSAQLFLTTHRRSLGAAATAGAFALLAALRR